MRSPLRARLASIVSRSRRDRPFDPNSRTSCLKLAREWGSLEICANSAASVIDEPADLAAGRYSYGSTNVRRTVFVLLSPCASVTVSSNTYWPHCGINTVGLAVLAPVRVGVVLLRSEEHTSELQSQSNLVCRL